MSDGTQQHGIDELNDQLRVRREKMEELRENGIDPFASGFEREDLAEDLQAKYEAFDKETLAEKTTEAVIAGRLISKRGKGKAGFAHLQDMSGQIQIYVRKDEIGE